jgi:hypothetical protein
VFEARKRRTRARLLKLLPPHLLPDEEVRILAFAVKNDLSVAYWLPIVLLGVFAIWAFAQGGQRVVYALLALLIVGANLLTVANGRWIVLTDRRFLVLKMNSGSGRRLLVERADPIRLGAVARTFSGLRGRGSSTARSADRTSATGSTRSTCPSSRRSSTPSVLSLVGSTTSRRRRRRYHQSSSGPSATLPDVPGV